MAILTCHVEKHGRNAIFAVDRHNAAPRTDEPLVTRPENSRQNRTLVEPLTGDLKKSIFTRVAVRANPERAVRKDAVLLCEVTVSVAELEEPPAVVHRFFAEATDFLRERYRPENTQFAVVHMDEELPHLHFGFVPMTPDLRLSAKNIIDRIELQRLQVELPEHLRSKGFQVERASSEPRSPEPNRSPLFDPLAAPPVEDAPQLSMPQLRPTGFNPQGGAGESATSLNRENQSLKLENLMLERQIKNIIEIIKSDSQLEMLYLRQVEVQAQLKREEHERRVAPLLRNEPLSPPLHPEG